MNYRVVVVWVVRGSLPFPQRPTAQYRGDIEGGLAGTYASPSEYSGHMWNIVIDLLDY